MYLSRIPELKGEVDVLYQEALGEELEKDGKIESAIHHYNRANFIYAKYYLKDWISRYGCLELLDHVRSLRKEQDRAIMEYNSRIGRFSADWSERYAEYKRTGTMPPRT